MKITNRIAGEWKTWDEFIDPVEISSGTIIAVWSEVRQRCMTYAYAEGLWMGWVIGEMSANESDLQAKYDAYCVIRGPWDGVK